MNATIENHQIGSVYVHKYGYRKWAVVKQTESGPKILKCKCDYLPQGLQLVYGTAKRAVDVMNWIKANPEEAGLN